MFIGFQARFVKNGLPSTLFFQDCYIKEGKKIFNDQKSCAIDFVSSILNDGSLTASGIEKEWFPSVDANVFISHSHTDTKLAISLAGWLYVNFGIKSFIDSTVWGYAEDLLRSIDNNYCVLKRDPVTKRVITYDYDKRNKSTAHVHMILNCALEKMIDQTECLLFLNTPNSIDFLDSMYRVTTHSPWIYSELQFSRMVRHKKLSEYRPQPVFDSYEHRKRELDIRYDVQVNHLLELDMDDLEYLYETDLYYKPNPLKVLDLLYQYKGVIKDAGKD